MSTTVTINNVRWSYCNLFQPKPPMNNPQAEPKYSLTLLIPKTNAAALAAIQGAISEAETAATGTKWNGLKPPVVPNPLHDGDGVRQDGSNYGAECRGCMVLTASSNQDHPPFVVDQAVQNIIDPKMVYSGCWGNVSVTFFGYNSAGKKGIGCGLNGAQFVRDDEPLGGRVTASDAFAPIQPVGAAAPGTPQPTYPSAAPYGAPQPTYPSAAPYGAPPMPSPWGEGGRRPDEGAIPPNVPYGTPATPSSAVPYNQPVPQYTQPQPTAQPNPYAAAPYDASPATPYAVDPRVLPF